MEAIDYIKLERQRQIGLGYDARHDDAHTDGSLFKAAELFLSAARSQLKGYTVDNLNPPQGWPWHADFWRPSHDPVRNLIVAGALFKAEYDRLMRAGCPVRAMTILDSAHRCVELIDGELVKLIPSLKK